MRSLQLSETRATRNSLVVFMNGSDFSRLFELRTCVGPLTRNTHFWQENDEEVCCWNRLLPGRWGAEFAHAWRVRRPRAVPLARKGGERGTGILLQWPQGLRQISDKPPESHPHGVYTGFTSPGQAL